MFEDALLESSSPPRRRRGVFTLLSALLQAALIAGGVLLPLLYMDALPAPQFRAAIYTPAAGSPPPVVTLVEGGGGHASPVTQAAAEPVRPPSHIPGTIDMTPDAPRIGSLLPGPGGASGPFIPGILGGSEGPGPYVAEGMLVERVQPEYPRLAREARIQGEVVLLATISREGHIENLRTVSGHPWLAQAAREAVQRWRYRPFLLSGEPVAVEAEVRVIFHLAR
jgi:protein TonB